MQAAEPGAAGGGDSHPSADSGNCLPFRLRLLQVCYGDLQLHLQAAMSTLCVGGC
jgi:hypothetical protein